MDSSERGEDGQIEAETPAEERQETPLDLIPDKQDAEGNVIVDEEGIAEKDFTAVPADAAWDGLVALSESDEEIAAGTAADMVEVAKANVSAAEKEQGKPIKATTPSAIVRERKRRAAAVAAAREEYDKWKAIAEEPARRKAAAETEAPQAETTEEAPETPTENQAQETEAQKTEAPEASVTEAEVKTPEAKNEIQEEGPEASKARSEASEGAAKAESASTEEPDDSNSLNWSEEHAANGEPFLEMEGVGIDLVEIPEEVFEAIGIDKIPFRLTPSMVSHVFKRHKDELGFKSQKDAVAAILEVMNNFDHVRRREDGAIIFSVENGRKKSARRAITLVLTMDSGSWLGLKTLGFDHPSSLKKIPAVWVKGVDDTSTTGVAPANVTTDQPSQSDQAPGDASNQTEVSSDDKVNALSSEKQKIRMPN